MARALLTALVRIERLEDMLGDLRRTLGECRFCTKPASALIKGKDGHEIRACEEHEPRAREYQRAGSLG